MITGTPPPGALAGTKLGLHESRTCVLSFGDGDDWVGEPVCFRDPHDGDLG